MGGGPAGREANWAAGGERRRERVGPVWAEVFLSLFYLLFNKLNFNYLNSNLNLNSTLTLKQIKIMHQHECNNKIKPSKILITCGTKLD
jgi:hypothetical protein